MIFLMDGSAILVLLQYSICYSAYQIRRHIYVIYFFQMCLNVSALHLTGKIESRYDFRFHKNRYMVHKSFYKFPSSIYTAFLNDAPWCNPLKIGKNCFHGTFLQLNLTDTKQWHFTSDYLHKV